MKALKLFTLFAFMVVLGVSCSGNVSNPVVDSQFPGDSQSSLDSIPVIEFDGSSALGLFGAYNLIIDTENNVEIVPMRSSTLGSSFIVSGKSFFAMTPCNDCLEIQGLSLDSDENVVLHMAVKHPFPKGDPFKPPTAMNRLDLDVFDLALIVVPTDIDVQSFPLTGAETWPGILLNADGYTRELQNVIGNNAVAPYKICYEDANYNRFEMETDFQPFDLVMAPGLGVSFELYMTMGYGASARRPERLAPIYYIPEFNRKAAWKVVVTPPQGDDEPTVGNTWSNTDTSTEFDVSIDIYDWNHGVTIAPDYPDPDNQDQIAASSDVSSVTIEVPGMVDAIIPATVIDDTTNGWDDPLTYVASFANQNALPIGEYFGLVKVTDTRVPGSSIAGGETDTLVHTPDGILLDWYEMSEFATYQSFVASVVTGAEIELFTPNGGEVLGVGSFYDITWETIDYDGMIKLEYSKDGFISDINEIIAATEDDGVYRWEVPDDPSTTVRVRASLADAPSVFDISDEDFEISDIGFELILDAPFTIDGPYIDESPSIITKPNGHVVISWAKVHNQYNNQTSDYRYSTDSGASWINPGYGTWGGTYPDKPITCMAIDAVGDAYHKFRRGYSTANLIVRFSSVWPNSGIYLTPSDHGIALIFTHDGYPVEFGDVNNMISYKKGLLQNSPQSPDWTGWHSTPQYTAVSAPSRLSQTRNILRTDTDEIFFTYFSSEATDAWVRIAFNSDGTGLSWNTGNDIYDGASDGYTSARESSIFLGDNDVWHSVFVLHTDDPTSTESIAYCRSTDGIIWDAPIEVYDMPGQNVLNWPNVQTVEVSGMEIITITYTDDSTVYLTFSWDQGQSWQPPVAISSGNDMLPDICTTPDGYLHNVWEHNTGSDQIVEYIRASYQPY